MHNQTTPRWVVAAAFLALPAAATRAQPPAPPPDTAVAQAEGDAAPGGPSAQTGLVNVCAAPRPPKHCRQPAPAPAPGSFALRGPAAAHASRSGLPQVCTAPRPPDQCRARAETAKSKSKTKASPQASVRIPE